MLQLYGSMNLNKTWSLPKVPHGLMRAGEQKIQLKENVILLAPKGTSAPFSGLPVSRMYFTIWQLNKCNCSK